MTGVKRGRPEVTKQEVIHMGDEKVTVNYIEAEERVQISVPGTWTMSAMASSAGRKRIDLVSANIVADNAEAAAIKAAQPKKPRKKRASKATVTPEAETEAVPEAKTKAKPKAKTPRRSKKSKIEDPDFSSQPAPRTRGRNRTAKAKAAAAA